MNQLIAIALGGASGAVARFLVSTGVYQWLGRGFPFGTLAVNLIGSLLLGLLTEALVLQRAAIALEYRAALLVGFLGAFTTFSTFSLETLYLIEQGSLTKAMVNIAGNLFGCLMAVWLGLLCGRTLFFYSGGVVQWSGMAIPYALMLASAIAAFLIGIIAATLLAKVTMPMEYRAAIMVTMFGAYLTLSGLYLILFLIEQGFSFTSHSSLMTGIFISNTLGCLFFIWMGLLAGRQL